MITIFNRKEIFLTYSMKEYTRIRDILAAGHVEYSVSTMGNVWRQARGRSFGMGVGAPGNSESAEYRMFVRKADYDRACSLINKRPS